MCKYCGVAYSFVFNTQFHKEDCPALSHYHVKGYADGDVISESMFEDPDTAYGEKGYLGFLEYAFDKVEVQKCQRKDCYVMRPFIPGKNATKKS